MITIFSRLYDLLDRRERQQGWLLFLLMILTGLADLVGVASIFPFLAMVADPAAARAQPLMAALYDRLGFSSNTSFLIFLGFTVLSILLTTLVIRLITLKAMTRFAYRRNHTISNRLLTAYLRQPYVWFLNQNTADLSRRVLYETEMVVMQGLLPAMRLIANLVTILCLVGLLVTVNPIVAFSTTLVLGGSYVLLSLLVRKLLAHAAEARAEGNHRRYRLVQEALTGIKDLKVLGAEESYIARYTVASQSFSQSGSTVTFVSEMPRHVLEMLAFGGMILLVLVLLATGSSTVSEVLPTLGVFAFSTLRLFPALQQVYLALTYIRGVRPMIEMLHRDVLATRRNALTPKHGAERRSRLPMTRGVRLVGVHYAYPQAEQGALYGLDLDIPARSTIGLVGSSGAGKTTAIDVLLGLLEPQSGQIMVDDVKVTRDNLRHWQDNVGYVPQNIFLIDGTIAENIALGVPPEAIDMAAVNRAAQIARLHNFIQSDLPQAYATPIGERGLRLSGGQRQRIGIARALYHDPDVLVLDEATSALDNLTEQAVIEAVQALGGQKTIIMIAHRLSTVRNCDCIYLMEQGQVVASGHYDALISDNDSFRRMARL